MAQRFMYVCFGILALAIAFHLGAKYGQAGYVDHSTTGIIAAGPGEDRYVLLDDGNVYHHRDVTGWDYVGSLNPPLPPSQIKFWLGPRLLISTANELWVGDTLHNWTNCGSPLGAAFTEPTTWSKIKAEFGE